jgi:hypothetical protein
VGCGGGPNGSTGLLVMILPLSAAGSYAQAMNDQSDWIIRTDDASPPPPVKADLHPPEDEPAEQPPAQLGDDYAMRLISARCGDDIDVAAVVVPMAMFEKVFEVIATLDERIDVLERMLEERA